MGPQIILEYRKFTIDISGRQNKLSDILLESNYIYAPNKKIFIDTHPQSR